MCYNMDETCGCKGHISWFHLHIQLSRRGKSIYSRLAIAWEVWIGKGYRKMITKGYVVSLEVMEMLKNWLAICVLSCSVVSNSTTPWIVAHQAPLSMGILQARILESVAMPSCRESSQPRGWTQVSHIAGRFFTIWVIREDCSDSCIYLWCTPKCWIVYFK